MRRLPIICDCHDLEHQFWFAFDPEDVDYPQLYLEIHLSKQPFFRRLLYAVKYIFGRQSKYGAFAEAVLSDNKVAAIEEFLSEFRNGPDVHGKV